MSNQTARGPTDYNLVRLTVAFSAMEICQNKNLKKRRYASILRKKTKLVRCFYYYCVPRSTIYN